MCLPIHPSVSIKSVSTDCDTSKKASFSVSKSINFMTVSVPTFAEKRKKHIEVNDLTSSDIELLKMNDPFMYYSIPAVRKATLQGKKVVPFLLKFDSPSNSMALHEESSSQGPKKTKVTRQSRISTECYPDFKVEEIICDPGFVAAMSKPSELEKKSTP